MNRPIRPLPDRRLQKVTNGALEQMGSLGLSLHFSVAHTLPWEVLLAICEQAEESTLVQLCLVSFGMLELAGPVLYRHVEIKTVERLHSYFIEPSIIPADSRLRPIIGPARMRSIHLDYRQFDPTRTAAIFTPSIWDRPDRRVSTPFWIRSSRTDCVRKTCEGIPVTDTILAIRSLMKCSRRNILATHWSPTADLPDTVDLTQTLHGRGISTRLGSASAVCPLSDTAEILQDYFGPGLLPAGLNKDLRVRVNLRRVLLEGPPSASLVHLRSIVTGILDFDYLWQDARLERIEFLVATGEVAKVVETAINSPAWDERRKRCRVIQS